MRLLLGLLFGLSYLVVPAVAGVLLGVAAALRHRLTRPHCRECRAPLSFEGATGLTACASCQRFVADTGEPIVIPGPRRWGLIATAGTLLLLAAASLAVLTQVMSAPPVTGAFLPQLSTRQIMSDALAGRPMGFLDESDLRRRISEGEDVSSIARLAFEEALLAQRGVAPPNANGTAQPTTGDLTPLPATRTGDAPARVAAVAFRGIASRTPRAPNGALLLNASDAAFARDVLVSAFPTLTLDAPSLRRTPAFIQFVNTGFINPTGELRRVIILHGASVDGTPIDMPLPQRMHPHEPMQLPSSLPAKGDLFSIDVELRLYDRLDYLRVFDAMGSQRSLELWPEPLAAVRTSIDTRLPPPQATE